MGLFDHLRHPLFALMVSCATCAFVFAAGSANAEPYEIKASWDDDEKVLTPAGADFYFQGLSTTHANGTIALADSLLLRIKDDQPFVTLGIRTSRFEAAPSFRGAASLPDGALLLSTAFPVDATEDDPGTSGGHLAKWWDGDKIEVFPMPPNRHPERPWNTPKLVNGPDGSVWALTSSDDTPAFEDPKVEPGQTDSEAGIFQLVESRWKEIPLPYVGAPYYVSDFCVVGHDDIWIVGSKLSIKDDGTITGRSGFAANRSSGDWALFTVPAPEGEPLAWNLAHLACRPGAPVYATGFATRDPERVPKYFFDGRSVVYATDGTRWHQQPSPKEILETEVPDLSTGLRIGASAVDANGRLWVSISEPMGRNAAFFSLDSGKWTRHELPAVPQVAYYAPAKIAFDESGTGWAISNLRGSATKPESHGILLRHDGEKWKHQGWKWNRLRQRGFGLLGGNLR
jgi:hypothetical protein